MKYYVLGFSLVYLISASVNAQLPFMAEQLTEAGGLLSNYVEEVAWDKQNRLWMATDKGVSVFNGSRMQHFTSANGLEQSYITELLWWPLSNSMIMLSPSGFLYASDGISLQQLAIPENEKVGMVGLLKDGNLVIACHNENKFLQWYVAKGLHFPKDLYPIYKEPDSSLLTICITSATTIEVSDKASFLKKAFDVKVKVETIDTQDGIVLKDIDQFSNCKVVLKKDSILFTENNTKKSFPTHQFDFKTIINPVSILYKGKSALLFFKYNSGDLLILSEDGNSHYLPAANTGLSVITSMKMGPGGMVFICTMGEGVYYFKPGSFELLFDGKKIARIAQFNDKYWVAADDEIVAISPGRVPLFSGIKVDAVTSITPTNEFLHVTGISSYYKFPIKNGGLPKPSFIFKNTTGFSGVRLYATDSFDISTYTFGLFRFVSNHSKPVTISLLDNIIERTINMDSGVAYTSYSAGTLIRFNNGKDILLNKQSGLLSSMVYDVNVNGDSIWVSTELGLNLYCKGSIYQYSKKEGFVGKRCLYTFLDKNNRRFVVSDACLMLLENGKLRPMFSYKIKKKGSSITSVLFSESAQQLLIGTSNGLTITSVEAITPDTTLLYPVLYKATTYEDDFISNDLRAKLPDGVHNFNFEVGYNYPDFSGGASLLYVLEGWNSKWQQVSSNYVVNFPKLSAGTYKLKMKAINADGFSSKEYTLSTFTILPPWYLQWYIITLYIIAIGIFIFAMAKLWARKKLARQMQAFKLQHQLEVERNRISSELHDNVGSQLTNIIAQLDYLENAVQLQPKQFLLEKVDGLQRKARMAMGQLRESIWVLKEDAIRLEDFQLKIHTLFEEVFVTESGVNYQIFPAHATTLQLSPWQAVNLLRVLQEGLQNIQKHASAKLVTLSFEIDNNTLKMELIDNGRGFKNIETGKMGHGLQNMKRRVNDLNGSLLIMGKEGNGTQLEIKIPLA